MVYRRIQTCFVILFVGLGLVSNAQLVEQIPCIDGPTVTLDSISFRPDRPFPFDRCFKIVLTVPAKPLTSRFAITPIGRDGESNFRRRDLKVLRTTIFPKKKDRKEQTDGWSYENFKSLPFPILYKISNSKVKGNKVELTLAVPPLDPRRQYRLILINDDDEAFTDILSISSSIIESRFQEDSGNYSAARSLLEDAKRLHVKSEGAYKIQNSIRFVRPKFIDYSKRLTRLKFYFNLNSSKIANEYRLFLSPKKDAPLLDAVEAEGDTNYILIKPKQGNQVRVLEFPMRDIRGNVIAPFQTGQYNIQVLSKYRGSKSSLTTLGVLSLSRTDMRYNFTPNDLVSDQVFASIDNDNILSHLHDVRTAIKVAGVLRSLTFKSHRDAISFLLTQARSCPCENKGVKDLTQKDDLMRTISLLFENNNAIFSGISTGERSLASPDNLTKTDNLLQMTDNLSVSIERLTSLMEFARKVEAAHPDRSNSIEELLTDLTSATQSLRLTKQNIVKLLDSKNKLLDEFRFKFGIVGARAIANGSTSSLNMISEAKFRIVPDFGFIGIFKGTNIYSFQDFTPYLGFQIGLRPIDKDIPFHLIRNKSILHRLSFMSGVTLTSIKIEDKREDFFAGRSLITGIGIRLTNSFRLTSGMVWFRTVNTNPLINSRPLGFSPFIGLSIDLELQSLFGGIAQIFKL